MSDETPMGQVIQTDEARIRDHLGEMVRGTVEETLNALLDAEADRLCNAQRYERSEARQDSRAGSYERTLHTKAGDVSLRVPKLRRQTFETAIIERYRRRESSVEEALIEMLSLPEIKSGYIGDGDRQGLDSKECFQRALPRAISAHPCSMTSECACRCNSPYTIAARGADGVRQIPRCDPCIPCGSNRSTVLHKRFAKVSEETSGDLEYRWT